MTIATFTTSTTTTTIAIVIAITTTNLRFDAADKGEDFDDAIDKVKGN